MLLLLLAPWFPVATRSPVTVMSVVGSLPLLGLVLTKMPWPPAALTSRAVILTSPLLLCQRKIPSDFAALDFAATSLRASVTSDSAVGRLFTRLIPSSSLLEPVAVTAPVATTEKLPPLLC